MPNNITDTSTFTATVQTVADGDSATAANFLLAPQGLANRTKFLYDAIYTNGVQAIRSVADINALKALTGMANNQVALVRGYGVFYYNSSSTATEQLPLVVTPTAGGGRWIVSNYESILYPAGVTPGGIAGTDTSGRVVAASVRNGLIAVYNTGQQAFQSSVDISTDVNFTGSQTIVNLKQNDFLVAHATVFVNCATPTAEFQCNIGFGSTNARPTAVGISVPGVVYTMSDAVNGVYTCDALDEAAGSLVVRAFYKSQAGNSARLLSLQTYHYRP